eukprot:7382939-Prymnesium_polylepis.1
MVGAVWHCRRWHSGSVPWLPASLGSAPKSAAARTNWNCVAWAAARGRSPGTESAHQGLLTHVGWARPWGSAPRHCGVSGA